MLEGMMFLVLSLGKRPWPAQSITCTATFNLHAALVRRNGPRNTRIEIN